MNKLNLLFFPNFAPFLTQNIAWQAWNSSSCLLKYKNITHIQIKQEYNNTNSFNILLALLLIILWLFCFYVLQQ